MNEHFRVRHFLAGMALPGTPPLKLLVHDDEGKSSTRVEFVQPTRFNRARYKRVRRAMHGKIMAAKILVTVMVVVVLGWKAASGEHISPERWLCGIGSGLFLSVMVRLALLAALAPPRFILIEDEWIWLSGFGALKADQILHWSLERGVVLNPLDIPCSRLEIVCLWMWWERRWTMFLNDNAEAALLQHMLKTRLPHAAAPTAA